LRDVIGQRRLLARRGEQADRRDVAHGEELSGPRSLGRNTTAVRLAQTLNCATEPGMPGGCGACVACRKIERGSHPDVREVTRLVDQPGTRNDARNITIDQIREMQQDLALRPMEGRWRVVIIDDAAELSDPAQVALLKTLEEPPPHAVLMLVTVAPSRLLETTRSRLQPLPFRPVPRAEIEAGLVGRFGPDAARFAAAASVKPGIAITLAADDTARGARGALEAEFYRLVASRLSDRFAWAAELSDERDTQKRNKAVDQRFVEWGELVRDAAVAAAGAAERATRPHRAEESRRLAASVPPRELIELAQSLERWRRDIADTTVSTRMLLELFSLTLPYRADVAAAS
jgi:DNA polymerase-3 subunit delta'